MPVVSGGQVLRTLLQGFQELVVGQATKLPPQVKEAVAEAAAAEADQDQYRPVAPIQPKVVQPRWQGSRGPLGPEHVSWPPRVPGQMLLQSLARATEVGRHC